MCVIFAIYKVARQSHAQEEWLHYLQQTRYIFGNKISCMRALWGFFCIIVGILKKLKSLSATNISFQRTRWMCQCFLFIKNIPFDIWHDCNEKSIGQEIFLMLYFTRKCWLFVLIWWCVKMKRSSTYRDGFVEWQKRNKV